MARGGAHRRGYGGHGCFPRSKSEEGEIPAAEGESMNSIVKHLAAAEKEAQVGSSIWLHIIEAMEELYVHGYDVPRGWSGYDVPKAWEVERLERGA